MEFYLLLSLRRKVWVSQQNINITTRGSSWKISKNELNIVTTVYLSGSLTER